MRPLATKAFGLLAATTLPSIHRPPVDLEASLQRWDSVVERFQHRHADDLLADVLHGVAPAALQAQVKLYFILDFCTYLN
jgi:hypothetical protein